MQWCQRLDADYGVDPWIWQSLHGPSFHRSSKLCLCNSFHGYFVPYSKEEWSIHALAFQWIYEILRQVDVSGGYHPEWGNPITKELTWYAVTDKWIVAQKRRILKIQFFKHMRIKKKEVQSVDTSFLLRIGNKIPMEGVTEAKFWAEMKGWTIQRLPHPLIHLIINH